jgi:hypothetical protein
VSRFSHGMRITDAVALDCAQEAAGQLRFEIEAAFSQGLPNTPMANATVRVVSGNFLTARPVGIVDGVDFMHSGLVRRSTGRDPPPSTPARWCCCRRSAFSPTGEAFNLTMEDVATSHRHRAAGRQAVFMTEVPGIRERLDDPTAASTPNSRWPTPSACWPPCRADPAHRHRLLPAALREGLRRRRGALAHPALRHRRRAAAGGLHARRHRHHGGRREAREPARGHRRRRRRHPAADRALRARRHAGARERTEIERDIANYT